MFRYWSICIKIVFILVIVSTSIAKQNQLQEHTIFLQNFDKTIELQKHENDYQVIGKHISIALSNRIIVKTVKSLSLKEILASHPNVFQISKIYSGKYFNYYLLELNGKSLISTISTKLKIMPGVLLVQPDILQKTIRSEKVVATNAENKTLKLSNTQLSTYFKSVGIASLWKQTKGRGIKIAIIDDGFNLKHEDLKLVKLLFSYDVSRQKITASPQFAIDSHGTKVAGIIFAQHNNIGIDGIAPEASLIAIRQPNTWTSETILGFQLAQLAGADIINCSWNSQWLLQPIVDVVNDLTTNGRQGKGVVVVFSAGNQGKQITAESTEASILNAVVVGASNIKIKKTAKGQYQRLKISNYGDSIDLFFMGNKVNTTLARGDYGYFAGTSLSAAIVSGFSALLLSQNSQLDIKQIIQKLKMVNQ